MIAFKCKICGGNLEIEQGERVSTCQSCGSTHSLPNVNNDKVRNLFERANQLRRDHEFDKAMGMYETIVSEQPDDPEVYWSLVLCKYGVEYVEDPVTKQRVITTHRTLPQSVQVDSDYKKAIELASAEAKQLYQEEAQTINEIQKNVLAISSQEDPYDVFICYKETDDQGRRTMDSVLAQEIHDELDELNYKVFFARLTLEDKLGQEYEPYIYSALKTSKVMLVIGTKQKYFEAPWVRNEWSRFLSMMKTDKQKKLIPLYKDIDAYDLPEEFRIFQSQDLNKIGATQDLIRGIKKLLPLSAPSTPEIIVNKNLDNSQVAPMIKRAMIAVEDGDRDKADEYAEKALDINPECAEAYLVKWLLDHNAKSLEDIVNFKDKEEQAYFSSNPKEYSDYVKEVTDEKNINYQKIKKYGSPELLASIQQAITKGRMSVLNVTVLKIEQVLIRLGSNLNENQHSLETVKNLLPLISDHPKGEGLNQRYEQAFLNQNAHIAMEQAKDYIKSYPEDLAGALSKLKSHQSIPEVQAFIEALKNSYESDLKKRQEAEALQNENQYHQITSLIKTGTFNAYKQAISVGLALKDYKDVASLLAFAKDKFKDLLSKRRKKQLRITIMSSIITAIVATTAYVLFITLPLDRVVQDGATYQKVDDAYHLIEFESNSKIAFNMPNGVRGLPIIEIKDRVFFQSTLQTLSLGHFVETIGDQAFKSSSLKEIQLNPNLLSLGNEVFSRTNLTAINIPSKVERLGEHIFLDTFSLKEIIIPFIGETVQLPRNMDYLFASGNRVSLESLTLTHQKTLNSNSFSNYVIQELYLEKSLEKIEFNALSNIPQLSKLSLPFIGESQNSTSAYHLGFAFGALEVDSQSEMLPASLKTVVIHNDDQIEPFSLTSLTYVEHLYFIEGTSRISTYALIQSTALKNIFISKYVSFVAPYAIYQVGDTIIHTDFETIPSSWPNTWNADNLEIVLGSALDEI